MRGASSCYMLCKKAGGVVNSKKQPLIMYLFAVVCVSGCSHEVPKCSDEDTFTLIRQIIVGQIGGRDGVSDEELQKNLRFELSRATAFDETIGKFSCEAKLIAGGTYELPISYESQLDDNEDHLVYLNGISNDLWYIHRAIAEGIKKDHGSATAAEKPKIAPRAQTQLSKQVELTGESKSVAAPADVAASIATTTVPLPDAAVGYSGKPSFNCLNASNFAEHSVCGNSILGSLDGALSENYQHMLASDIGDGTRDYLRTTQREWMSMRNACTDLACLEDAYRKRVDEVCEHPVITGIHADCIHSDEIK
jgi:uncharacterized protein YecT (DUF1311 family)